jgi:hypothetical protein
MAESSAPHEPEKCEKCGAPPSRSAGTAVEDEPITHCEWCGAEYPAPDDDGSGEDEP